MSRLTIAVVLLILAAAAALFVVRPQWERVKEARLSIQELGALSQELGELAASRDALAQEYNAVLESDLAKLRAIAPADRGTAAVLADFEALAQKNILFLDQVDFVAFPAAASSAIAPPGSRLYGTIPVTMTLRGTYENFREFLAALEKNLRLVDINEITFSSSQEKEFPITIKGTLYYRQ